MPALARLLLRIAGMKTSRRKLTIRRESLRVLSADRLARIAGGEDLVRPPKAGYGSIGFEDVLPRTNAWTTGVEYVC